ncbi:oxidoreductase [Lewinellaceae bacterium SD302]|nr:oxidoreductase [Lewinellaceae bacterium SD302]
MLKIGLLGTGHLGKIHLKCIRLAKESYELIGFYDANPEIAASVAREYKLEAFDSPAELIAACDVVDIVTPTTTHYALVKQALLAGRHVFVEKPLTSTLEEARELVEICERTGLKVQVGHVERFNPALLALGDHQLRPFFIEAHRLATFNPRGTDVSVILDLMIHDLDIILKLANSEVAEVRASGVAVVSKTPDIVNARIEFVNGAVANLTASRFSMKNMRKIRLFQPDAYISIDLLDKETQFIRLFDVNDPSLDPESAQMTIETADGVKVIDIAQPDVNPVNAIQLELESLAASINEDSTPAVSIHDGYRALELAYLISEAVEENRDKIPV